MLKKILIAIALTFVVLVAPLSANIYWVAETVAADVVGTVNTFADPYGIQIAFTTAACDDEVRVIQGADDYDSTSTSWTNRAADKTIDWVRNCSAWQPVMASCWSDETTEVTSVGACVMDFEGGTGNGFELSNGGKIWKSMAVINANGVGVNSGSSDVLFYRIRVSGSGSVGINAWNGSSINIVECVANNNVTFGLSIDGTPPAAIYLSESYLNATGIYAGEAHLFKNIVHDNTGDGIVVEMDGGMVLENVSYNNGANGLTRDANAHGTIYGYNVFADNTTYGYTSANQIYLSVGNNFYNNTTDARLTTVVPRIDLDSTPDETAVTFTDPTNGDFTQTTEVQRSISFPRAGTDTGLVGAVQVTGAGGATAHAH